MSRQLIPAEAVISLQQRLELLPARCRERKLLIEETANLYGISKDTLYRLLREQSRPKSLRRADRGQPRKLSQSEMESYCEVIAAFKIRTSNKKGRHLSTTRAIELLEEYGVDTPNGFVQPPQGLLTKTTVNRYLKTWGYDQERMTRQPPAVRFQADDSNDCWHFDLSPSDLKHIAQPAWVEPGRGNPLLMLYSVVDDRSGMCYQEYHCVYGENVSAALRFLFNAMTAKTGTNSPFQGIPAAIYNELYVELQERRYGPFYPVDGPIPLHRYRKFKKSRTQERADRIAILAKQLELPRAALTGNADLQFVVEQSQEPALAMKPFQDPDPYREFTYPTTLIAALFYDLSTDEKEVKIPSLGEKRERELRDLIKKGKITNSTTNSTAFNVVLKLVLWSGCK